MLWGDELAEQMKKLINRERSGETKEIEKEKKDFCKDLRNSFGGIISRIVKDAECARKFFEKMLELTEKHILEETKENGPKGIARAYRLMEKKLMKKSEFAPSVRNFLDTLVSELKKK